MLLYTLDNKFIKEDDEIPVNFTGIVEYSLGSKFWFKEGKLHRLDGPARELLNGTKEWWVNDKQAAEEDFSKGVLLYKLKTVLEP